MLLGDCTRPSDSHVDFIRRIRTSEFQGEAGLGGRLEVVISEYCTSVYEGNRHGNGQLGNGHGNGQSGCVAESCSGCHGLEARCLHTRMYSTGSESFRNSELSAGQFKLREGRLRVVESFCIRYSILAACLGKGLHLRENVHTPSNFSEPRGTNYCILGGTYRHFLPNSGWDIRAQNTKLLQMKGTTDHSSTRFCLRTTIISNVEVRR
ncbi:hypothetical protein DFH08DRAFT_988592 [Mycena albidolilacea]|uniref:Uncharacterized protein n=1 Tax=Mycena albidolilacea TaxID=1033008 RepID=A0AAD6Z0R2_9AGAR|nr:hypothetical protein DFH08DRAFT_988592 [Mycena albidolilacea]